ncbi:MAG TPA: hypothetical protein VN700_14955 [Vicinamibacterales bacterium]|nr:hypothetical protein [Vicinamibacterales bacterium]
MTRESLEHLLHQYRAGLDAELALLRQLEQLASRQRDLTDVRDLDAFGGVGDERERVTSNLLAIEETLRVTRDALKCEGAPVRALPDYSSVADLHRRVSDLVARILDTDKASLQILADADRLRRAALAGLQRGESTLKAYRRTLAPTTEPAALVNNRW